MNTHVFIEAIKGNKGIFHGFSPRETIISMGDSSTDYAHFKRLLSRLYSRLRFEISHGELSRNDKFENEKNLLRIVLV